MARWRPALIKAAAADMVNSAPDLIVAAANAAVAEAASIDRTQFRLSSPGCRSGRQRVRDEFGAARRQYHWYFRPPRRDLGGKWVEVLRDAAPAVSRFAAIHGSDSKGNVAFLATAEAAARSIAVPLTVIDVSKDQNLDVAPRLLRGQPGGGLIVIPHPWNDQQPQDRHCARRTLPAARNLTVIAFSQPTAAWKKKKRDNRVPLSRAILTGCRSSRRILFIAKSQSSQPSAAMSLHWRQRPPPRPYRSCFSTAAIDQVRPCRHIDRPGGNITA